MMHGSFSNHALFTRNSGFHVAMDTTHVIPICILSMFNQIVEFCISDVAFNTNRNTLYYNFIKFVIFHRCFRRNTYEICGLEYVLKRRIASYNVWIVISPTYSAWKHFQMSWCISVEPRIVVAVIMLSMKRFSMSNCQLDHRKRHRWNSSHDTQHPCQNWISKYFWNYWPFVSSFDMSTATVDLPMCQERG